MQMSDTNKSGYLNIYEFETAYDNLRKELLSTKTTQKGLMITLSISKSFFSNLYAVRWHRHTFCFQIYQIRICKLQYNPAIETYHILTSCCCCCRVLLLQEGEKIIYESYVATTITELSSIMRFVHDDAASFHVKWWIDLTVSSLTSTEKEHVARLLGIPNKNIIVSSANLTNDRSSRVRAGVDSVSFFISTIYVKNVPLVHSHPKIVQLLG